MPRTLLSLPLVLALVACRGPADFVIELEQSERIPTVFTARWSVDLEAVDAAWFELGRDGAVERTLPVDPAGGPAFETVLYGMKPVSEYGVRAVVEVDGERRESRLYTVSTGQVPAELPDLELERVQGSETWQGLLVGSVISMPPAAVMIDEDGDYVWWYALEGVDSVGRARLARDGRSVLMLDINLQGDVPGSLFRVGLDGTGLEVLETQDAHHDFVELPDGTIAYLGYAPREIDGVQVPGDRVVELAPDGTSRIVWDAWEDPDLEFSPSDAYMGRMWPHANAIDYLEEQDDYQLSMLSLDAIWQIDRASGAVDWRLGGELSDFSSVDQGTDFFDHQHQFQWLDGAMLVFVNGPMQLGVSRVVEYAISQQTGGAWLAWEHESDSGLSSMVLGDVHRFDGGNTLITWSYSGVIQEVDPVGAPLWTLAASVGGAFGYTTWLEALPSQ
jgi:hypothetical protein